MRFNLPAICLLLLAGLAYPLSISSCQDLSSAGATYTLSQNVSNTTATCFTVTAANVALDCAGYSMTGGNITSTYGIYSNQFNTTIRNCNISNFQHGIYFQAATNGTIQNASVSSTSSSGRGIAISNSNYNTITNSTGISTTSIGIELAGSFNNVLSNVTGTSSSFSGISVNSGSNYNTIISSTGISVSNSGISIISSSNNTLSNSNGTSNSGTGIILSSSSNNVITNSTGTSTSSRGIYIDSSSNNTITNSIGTSSSNFAIYFYSSSNNTITNSIGTSTSGAGIYLASSSNNTIANSNGTSNSGTGIILFSDSNYNVITNSTGTAATSGPGISLYSSSNNTITSSNGTSNSGTGIYLESSSNYNTIISSIFTSDSGSGVILNSASNNAISNSNGTSNSNYGIYLLSSSNNNTIIFSSFTSTSRTGIYLSSSSNNTISNSTGTSNSYRGIDINGPNNTFINSTGMSNSSYGIYSGSTSDNNTLLGTIGVSNYSTAIYGGGKNTLIDCQGKSMAGTNAGSSYGIYANQPNTTVKNCNLSNFYYGIYLVSSENSTVSGNTVQNINKSGILLDGGSNYGVIANNTVSNCTSVTNDMPALGAFSSSYVNITNNTVLNNRFANIQIDTSSYSLISGNYVAGPSYGGNQRGILLTMFSYYNNIRDNVVNNMSYNYWMCCGPAYNNFTNNTALYGTYGILTYIDDYNNFANNTVMHAADGIYVWESNYNNYTGNLLVNNTNGVYFRSGANQLNNTISGNSILNSSVYGAWVNAGSVSNNLSGNNIAGCGQQAVYVQGAASNFFSGNNISSAGNSSYYPVYLSSNASGNQFSGNTITSPNRDQSLVVIDASSSGNVFYHNNFTATSSYYVNDLNSSNHLNTTINGKPAGNLWANVLNGSVNIFTTNLSPSFLPDYYYGDSGTDYPYSNSTSQGKIYGASTDYAPIVFNDLDCGNLSVANRQYSMNKNLSINGSTCFTVTAPNVTLFCNGHSIRGNNTATTYGIYSNQFNTTIRNCNISNFDRGISFNTMQSGLISNVTSRYNLNYGIYLSGANLTTVDRCNVSNNTANSGIYLSGSSNNTITNNYAEYNGITADNCGGGSCQAGITLWSGSSYNMVANNTISKMWRWNGIIAGASSNYNTIDGNAVSDSDSGIAVRIGANYNTISNNLAFGYIPRLSFRIDAANNNIFVNNTASNYSGVDGGFYVGPWWDGTESANNTFIGNTFTGGTGGYGFKVGNIPGGAPFSNTHGNSFISNTIINATYGFNLVATAFNNSFAGNTIQSPSSYGIYAGTNSSNNTFLGTTIANASSQGIYVSGGTNNTIDCQGNSITGTNASSTYGVYSNQPNTTVKNCVISNFHHGLVFSGVQGGLIDNVSASTSKASGYGLRLAGSSNVSISNSTAFSSQYLGLALDSGSNYNNITGVNASSTSSAGIFFSTSSNNIISSTTGVGGGSEGMHLDSSCNYNTIANSSFNSSNAIGLFFSSSSSYNTIQNVNASSVSSVGLYLKQSVGSIYTSIIASSSSNIAGVLESESSATIYNSTFVSGSKTGNLVSIISGSTGNAFYHNNFTETSGYYVNDASGGNYYNTTANGSPEGNIWFNSLNGSLDILGTRQAFVPGMFYGDSGTNYPYNSTTSGGKVTSNVIDFAPVVPNVTAIRNTPNISSISISPSSPYADSALSCTVLAIDLGQSSFNVTYGWYLNGFLQSNLTATQSAENNTLNTAQLQLSSSITSVGDNWSCAAYANYSDLLSATLFSSSVTVISNPLPPTLPPSGGSSTPATEVKTGALGISASFDCYKGQLTVVASTLGQPISNLKAVLFKSGRSTTTALTNTLGEAIFSIYEDGDYFVVVDDPYVLGNTKQTDVTGLKLCLQPAAENTTSQNQSQPALPKLPTLPRWRGCGSPIGAIPPSPVVR